MLETELYQAQEARWPKSGRHLLAWYDETSILVYQAYSPAIGRLAAATGRFGDNWSRTRMSWIKPNFLWMMYRSGWGAKEGQEVVLALRLRREGFDQLLAQAVHSSYVSEVYGDRQAWKTAVKRSEVRLQWDPDHHPHGAPSKRRAIQLGLQGRALERFADEWILDISDISPFVAEQRERVRGGELEQLLTPRERVYRVADRAVADKLGVDAFDG